MSKWKNSENFFSVLKWIRRGWVGHSLSLPPPTEGGTRSFFLTCREHSTFFCMTTMASNLEELISFQLLHIWLQIAPQRAAGHALMRRTSSATAETGSDSESSASSKILSMKVINRICDKDKLWPESGRPELRSRKSWWCFCACVVCITFIRRLWSNPKVCSSRTDWSWHVGLRLLSALWVLLAIWLCFPLCAKTISSSEKLFHGSSRRESPLR